jgi:carbon-monoxide dehydrogenase medium subunit
MKPAPFHYHAPATRSEAFGLLARLEDARVLAGGQSLVPMLALRLAAPENLIDLNGIADLAGIRTEEGRLVVGAMTRQRHAERSPLVAEVCPLLADALTHVGHQQTRNRGTIGGSIAHMDPTAELPVVASALDALVVLENAEGARRVPFAQWSTGYLATAIEPGEILTAVEFPIWPSGHGWGFEEVTRRGESYSIIAVAALVALGADGTVSRSAIAIGGLGPAAVRARQSEDALAGKPLDDAAIQAAGEASSLLEAEGDLFADETFKRHLAHHLVLRALRAARGRARPMGSGHE